MRTFAFSDIHGQDKLFKQIMDYLNSLDEDFSCYYLGDACDRGPDGYAIMKQLLSADPHRFTYLKGNHEDMFVTSANEFIAIAKNEGYGPRAYAKYLMEQCCYTVQEIMLSGSDMYLHWHNGGLPTFTAWVEDGCPTDILKQLDALPLCGIAEIVDDNDNRTKVFDMCHAGCLAEDWNDQVEEALLWERNHFHAKWIAEDDCPHIMIHGHTPVTSMPLDCRKNNGISAIKILKYADNTKIDLDLGCFRYHTICLYDFLNDEEIYFEDKNT